MDLYMRWSASKLRWKFGYSKQFRIIMNTPDKSQPHHLIPQELFDKLVGPMRGILESGFHPFMKINGINVPEKILGNSVTLFFVVSIILTVILWFNLDFNSCSLATGQEKSPATFIGGGSHDGRFITNGLRYLPGRRWHAFQSNDNFF